MIQSERAPAKVNLALHLRQRRSDGYHDLETVFAFTEFGDTVSVAASDELSLVVGGDFAGAAGTGSDNLVLKAARALAAAAGIPAMAALTLEKRIPVAAGLGGGSADAAAALRLLDRFWRLGWDETRLLALAATLGADVPACIASRTALGTGRGDSLAAWSPAVTGRPVLLVNPRVAVATGPVFAGWDAVDRGAITAGAALGDLRNDLTPAAVALAPAIAKVLAALTAAGGADLVRMSGSGATCLALYPDATAMAKAAASIADRGWWQMETRLL